MPRWQDLTEGEKIVVGGAAAVAAVLIADAVRSRSSPGTSPQSGPSSSFPQVTFLGGPTGTVAAPVTGAVALTPLVTRVANPGASPATVSLQAPIVPVSGTSYQGARWFTLYGGLAQGVATITVTVPAGGYLDITWNTHWSGNPGTYQSRVVVSMAGQTQTFAGPQFTVTLQQPAAPQLSFSGGWSGSVQIPAGATVRPPTLYTTLANTGGTAATFAVSVAITGGPSGLR